MSIAVEMPPAMMTEARSYAVLEGSTVEQFVFNCLKAEIERKHEAQKRMDAFDALVRSTSARRKAPYAFRRSDAYEETLA